MNEIAIYINENSRITDMFVNVNGSKSKITSGWVFDMSSPRKIFSSNNMVNGIKIVSWSDGTDEEVSNMLNAHYNGEINIHDYWHVGDERVVHLSAISASGYITESHSGQDVTFVLMHSGGFKLSDPINDKTTCAFVVGQKNALKVKGKMHGLASGGYTIDPHRILWLNEKYNKSLPSIFCALFKNIYKYGACFEGDSHKMMQYTGFSFWLPSELNIYGVKTYSSELEKNYLFQFEYYKNKENICKRLGDNGSFTEYWLNSIAYNNDTQHYVDGFCTVLENGNASYKSHTKSCGIAPFGCI